MQIDDGLRRTAGDREAKEGGGLGGDDTATINSVTRVVALFIFSRLGAYQAP